MEDRLEQPRKGKRIARDLIVQADSIAFNRGLNQAEWSRLSGHAENGQTVSRIICRGECKLSTFASLVDVLGCKIVIVDMKE